MRAVLPNSRPVDYGRITCSAVAMKDYPIATRFSKEELKKLDATAKLCGMTRSEVVRARALGKILTTHELAAWAEAEALRIQARKTGDAARSS